MPEAIRKFEYRGRRIEIVIHELNGRFQWRYTIDGIEQYELRQVGWPDPEMAFGEADTDARRKVDEQN